MLWRLVGKIPTANPGVAGDIHLEKRTMGEGSSAMTRPLSLSFTALCVFTCLSCTAQAQELVPIFQLSAEETAKGKPASTRGYECTSAIRRGRNCLASVSADLPIRAPRLTQCSDHVGLPARIYIARFFFQHGSRAAADKAH